MPRENASATFPIAINLDKALQMERAFVLGENGWQVIDTNAHVLMKQDISATDGNCRATNALFYNAGRTWRFWDLEQNQAPTISFDEYDPSWFP